MSGAYTTSDSICLPLPGPAAYGLVLQAHESAAELIFVINLIPTIDAGQKGLKLTKGKRLLSFRRPSLQSTIWLDKDFDAYAATFADDENARAPCYLDSSEPRTWPPAMAAQGPELPLVGPRPE